MTAELGPLQAPPAPVARLPRPARWTPTTGIHLLVVDPGTDASADATRLAAELEAESGQPVGVTCVRSTIDGLVQLGRTQPAVVVLAPEAPGVPAAEFVATVRSHSTALVVAALTCADAVEAGPLMLAGAAAAVIRPYTGRSLWRTLSNVPGGLAAPQAAAPELVGYGPLEVDARSYVVRVDGEPIADLPAKEFEMLRALASRAPGVVSNDDLRLALWGDGGGGGRSDNTLAVHVTRLRHRLVGVAHIRRIRGRGYSLTLP